MTPDERYMRQALRLAGLGRGKTRPNPMVGAVVVRDGRVVGTGSHPGPGLPHAELLALTEAGAAASGATLYTTLEPCCHLNKRTPPCTGAILRSGVRRVVTAMMDPNPQVSGKGVAVLRKAGIEVEEGLCLAEALHLNAPYVKFITTGCPYVILKAAATLDGRIATRSGQSQWITSEAARRDARKLRAEVDAVLVGVGTVLADNPRLTARISGARNPLRVVIDPMLKTPMDSHLLMETDDAETLVVVTSRAPKRKTALLQGRGVAVEVLPSQNGIIPFDLILSRLGQRGIMSLLIEGGSGVNGLALRSGIVDRVIFYLAPKLLGGGDAIGLFSGKAISDLAAAVVLRDLRVKKIGGDLRVEGVLRTACHLDRIGFNPLGVDGLHRPNPALGV